MDKKNTENNKKEGIEVEKYMNRNIDNSINQGIGKIDLELLLLNTLTITDLKVQTVTDKLIVNKP